MVKIVVVLTAALVGCTKPNPNVCCATDAQCAELGVEDLRPCDVGQACAPDHSCVAAECAVSADCAAPDAPICANGLCIGICASSADCTGVVGRPLCSPDGACVGCLDVTQCSASMPVCDAEERACRGCERDDECASGVCIEVDGVCAAESRVVFVSDAGTDGECSRVLPCLTFSYALSKLRRNTRDVIHVIGGTYGLGTTTSDISLPVIIDGSQTTLGFGSSSPAFTIGSTGELTLERVTIRRSQGDHVVVGATGLMRVYLATIDAGIRVSGGSAVFRDSAIESSGITVEPGGMLDIEGSSFDQSQINVDNATVAIERSRFFESRLAQYGGKATVTNSLFVQTQEYADNATLSVSAGSRFAFNTVVNTSTLVATGVALYCSTSLDISSNIFAYNSTNPINGAACTVRNSLFDTAGAGDASGNATGDASTFFRDREAGDFRPSAMSPALDGGELGIVDTDIEGNPRGASPDIGAFEAL